ncbi:MAG: alkaline phosphatase, partial [Clostridia bacterium]|nr:alkaline phosphatase [Clostridia bacterium]
MRLKKLLSLMLALMMVMSMFTITATTVSAANTGKVKNVIYIIGDGAGFEPFKLADAVKQAGGIKNVYPNAITQTTNKLYIKDYLVGGVTTYPAGASVTDSAASGTALAVGHKAGLYSIGVDAYLNPKANILEAAELKGKRVGVVSKYEFSHATPAAFTAHYYNRGVYRPMSEQAVYQDYDVNLCPGIEIASFNNVKSLIQQRGYRFVNNKTDLANVKSGDKIWSNLNGYTHPFDIKKSASDANLLDMTKAAITALDGSNEGFAVMIEAAMIDTGGHDNDALENVGDYIEWDETCKWAIEWAQAKGDTIVVMTADHDTGGMNIVNQSTAVSQIRSGVNPTSALTWDSKDHTARNVPLCIYAPAGITMPSGTSSTPGNMNNFTNYVIDNDDIAPWIADCLGLDLADATDELFVNVTSKGSITPKTDENGATNTCATFKFSGVNVSIEANQSVATINGDKVDLGGQIAVWEPYNNRFYVPQRLLDYMATGDYPLVPLTWTGNVKAQEGFNGYYGDFAVNAAGSLTLAPGATASFTWNAPYTGVYGMQIKCASIGTPTTLRATVGDYYGDYYFTTTGWSNNPAMYQDQAIYFKAGTNTINVENVGSANITISEFDFGRLDATGFDSMDYLDFCKRVDGLEPEENALITTTAITKMGTAGTFWGNVSTYEGVTNVNNTAITMAAGGWATFNVPVATDGLYYLKVKASGGNTTLNILANDEYYGDLAVGTADQYYTAGTDGDYEIIYLPVGKATVKVQNTGSAATTISDIQFGATQDLVDAGITPTKNDAKKMATWVGAAQDQDGYFNGYTSDGEPEVTLAPGEFTTITVNDIPYTGVYAFQLRLPTISGTAKVRVTTDKGYYGDYAITEANTWTNRMTPGQDQPIYFTTGTNTFYIENIGTTSFYIKDYDIGRMDGGNSMDFAYLLKQTDR